MLTDGTFKILLGSSEGKMVIFDENEVRIMGRNTSGVKAIDIPDDVNVVGFTVLMPEDNILIVTEKGYGKITPISEYRLTHRGSKGVKALNVTEKNGNMVSIKKVDDFESYDLVIVTNSGVIMKMPMNQISVLKRNTQGTRLIKLKDDQLLSTVAIVNKEEESDEENELNIEDNTVENDNLNNTDDNNSKIESNKNEDENN